MLRLPQYLNGVRHLKSFRRNRPGTSRRYGWSSRDPEENEQTVVFFLSRHGSDRGCFLFSRRRPLHTAGLPYLLPRLSSSQASTPVRWIPHDQASLPYDISKQSWNPFAGYHILRRSTCTIAAANSKKPELRCRNYPMFNSRRMGQA